MLSILLLQTAPAAQFFFCQLWNLSANMRVWSSVWPHILEIHKPTLREVEVWDYVNKFTERVGMPWHLDTRVLKTPWSWVERMEECMCRNFRPVEHGCLCDINQSSTPFGWKLRSIFCSELSPPTQELWILSKNGTKRINVKLVCSGRQIQCHLSAFALGKSPPWEREHYCW